MALVDIHEVTQTVPPDLVEIDGTVDPAAQEASLAAHAAQLAMQSTEQAVSVDLSPDQTAVLGATASRGRATRLLVAPKQRAQRRRPGSENSTDLYLDDIGQEDRLTRDDEVELSKHVQRGFEAQSELAKASTNLSGSRRRRLNKEVNLGLSAERTFVTANLRLVVHIAKKYADGDQGLLLDFAQDGSIGLMRAAQKFDWTRGFTFANYATWWINQSIQKGPTLRSKGLSGSVPTGISRLIVPYLDAIDQLQIEGVTDPTDEEITEVMSDSVTVNDLENVRAVSNLKTARLDDPVGEDTTTTMGDLQPDPRADHQYSELEDQLQTHDVLLSLRHYLSRSEYLYLIASFGFADGDPMSNGEIVEFVSNNSESKPMTIRKLARLREDTLTKIRHPAMYPVIKQLMPELVSDQDWQTRASCGPEDMPDIVDTNLGRGASRARLNAIAEGFKDICNNCPVWSECLAHAQSMSPKAKKGVWGGELFVTDGIMPTSKPD